MIPARAELLCTHKCWQCTLFVFSAVVDMCLEKNCHFGDCLITLTPPYFKCSCKPPYKRPSCQRGEHSAGLSPLVVGRASWPVCSGKSPTAEGDPALVMLLLPSITGQWWVMLDLQGGGSVIGKNPRDMYFTRFHENWKPTGWVGALPSFHWAYECLCSVQHIDKAVLCFPHWQHPNSAAQTLAKMEAPAYGTDTDQNSPASALNLSEGDSARSVCHGPSGGRVNLQRARGWLPPAARPSDAIPVASCGDFLSLLRGPDYTGAPGTLERGSEEEADFWCYCWQRGLKEFPSWCFLSVLWQDPTGT